MKTKNNALKKLTCLKSKSKKLALVTKILTSFSFALLGASLISGITAFSLKVKDNIEQTRQNQHSQESNSPAKIAKTCFLTSSYTFFAFGIATVITNKAYENIESKIEVATKSKEKFVNNNESEQ